MERRPCRGGLIRYVHPVLLGWTHMVGELGSSRLLLAAGGVPPLVQDLGICLVAAVALAFLCERLRLPHFIGFIVAGLLVGPPVLGAVHSPEDIRVMADLGIVMLLFLLGVELDVAALRERGRGLLTVGLLQVPLTVSVSLVAWLALAAVVGWPARFEQCLYLALATAFSSTLLVVRSLEGGERIASAVGTLCIGTLLAQDLWALLILSLQPGGGASAVGLLSPILGTALLGGVTWLVGRPMMTAVIVQFEESADLLSLSALAWCLACSLLAEHLGWLSAALGSPLVVSSGAGLGAFLGGLTLASVPQARGLIERLVSLRDFFVLFFFVSLGMSIPWPITNLELVMAVLFIAVLVASRGLVMWPLLRVSGAQPRLAGSVTAQMSQASEFGLVIVYLGHDLGHIGTEVVTVVLVGFVLTSGLMPLLELIVGRIERPSEAPRRKVQAIQPATASPPSPTSIR